MNYELSVDLQELPGTFITSNHRKTGVTFLALVNRF